MIIQAETGKFGDAKLFPQDTFRVVPLKDPVFDARFYAASPFQKRGCRGLEKLLGTREKSLAGMEELELVAKRFLGLRAGKFCSRELAGGEVHEGQADRRAGRVPGDGREVIIFASVEYGGVGGGAGRYHADDFAANELLAGAGLVHLIADGNLEAAADPPGDVAVSGVVRHAAHGNGLALFALTRGESSMQFTRGDHGVFVKKLVEVAEPT